MILQVNLLELLSGSDGKLPYSIKNRTDRFVTGLSQDFYFKEVNDINDFEASKFGGTIEWESVFKFLKNLKFFLSKKFLNEI